MEIVTFLCDHSAAKSLFSAKGMLTGGRNPTRRYKILQKACKRLGLPQSGLHCFRRSRATEIYRRCGIKVAAQMLGDSEGIALKHYIEEVGPEQIRKEVFGEG